MSKPAAAVSKQAPRENPQAWIIILVLVVLAYLAIHFLFHGSGGGGGGGPTPELIYPKSFVELSSNWTCTYASDYTSFDGSVKNTSNQNDLGYVKLRATLLMSDGTMANSETGYVDSDVVAMGQASTFHIMVSNPGGVAKKCQLTVEDASFTK
jgi:hypothetical protein